MEFAAAFADKLAPWCVQYNPKAVAPLKEWSRTESDDVSIIDERNGSDVGCPAGNIQVMVANVFSGNIAENLKSDFVQESPDVIFLQEDYALMDEEGVIHSVGKALSKKLDMKSYFYASVHVSEDEKSSYGVSVLSKYTLDECKEINAGGNSFSDYMLSSGRVAGDRHSIICKIGGLRFMNLHLPSAGKLSQSLDSIKDEAASVDFVLGDFNTLPLFTKALPCKRDWQSDKKLLLRFMKSINKHCKDTRPTHKKMKFQKFDWVFASSDVEWKTPKVIQSKGSDHNYLQFWAVAK